MQIITGLTALLAAMPIVEAAQAHIQNNCPDSVYLWAVDGVRNPQTPFVLESGKKYTEDYQVLPSGGVSIKISRTDKLTHHAITQFEYTLIGGFIWYDGSNVNCRGEDCPFYKEGIYMDTSDSTCPTRTCKQNADCTGFYIEWNDDINTLSCRPDADINMFLCSNKPVYGVSESTPATTKPGSNAGSTPKGTAPTGAAAAPAAAQAPSKAADAPAVAVSVKVTMDAPAPWVGRGGHNDRFVKKIKAREAGIDTRDLHAHMRRHNHRRSH